MIDTGDHVYHEPTDEHWLVAYVENGNVVCCGWPLTYANLSDCTLTQKATPGQRDNLLKSMANISEPDPRREYARDRLNKVAHGGPSPNGDACK